MMAQGGTQPRMECAFLCGLGSDDKDQIDETKPIKWGRGDSDRLTLPNGNSAVYGSDSCWCCNRTPLSHKSHWACVRTQEV